MIPKDVSIPPKGKEEVTDDIGDERARKSAYKCNFYP
jgi:hypothetical protein